MSSLERGPGGPSEHPQRPETEPVPYHRTARFVDAPSAGVAYGAVQRTLFEGPPNDLSAYRFQLNRIYHVTVLGQVPPAELDEQLTAILANGEPVELPADVLAALSERRRQMSGRGPWSEGHVRPVPPKEPDDPARDGGSRR